MSKNSTEVNARYDAKRAGQRTRNWTLVFYPENLPEDWREQVDELR
ncbi:MAG: Rep family protein, partial [Ruminococcus sp.]